MNYTSHPKHKIEGAIIDAKLSAKPINRILKIRKNWDKIIYKRQPEIRPTENLRIKKLENKIYKIETKLRQKTNNIESIINMKY